MRQLATLVFVCILSFSFNANALPAFDEDKAKQDYKGAVFKVSAIKEGRYENAPSIEIAFTVPLSKKLLKPHHAVLANEAETEHFILSPDRSKIIFPFIAPDKGYTVVLSSEIRDINHQKLGNQKIKAIKTRKIEPFAGFVSSGHILSASSPKKLPVSTLNIDEVDIDFFAIDPSGITDFLQHLGSTGRNSYYHMDKIRHYGKLVHSGRFALNPRKNQRTVFNIDLERIRSLSGPGIYAAVMRVPGRYNYQYEYTYFMQTDIGLHARRYTDSFDVYAQDIRTGKPLKNVRLELISRIRKNQDTRETAFTDENGRARFAVKPGQNCVIATKEKQFSLLRLTNSALDLSALKNANTSHSEYQIFAWGPRDLYRPSETVKVNILVRDFDGMTGPDLPLGCTVIKPDGSRETATSITPDFKGFYRYEYRTDTASQTGTYQLKLTFAGDNTATYSFRLEDFLPERLDLTLYDGTFEKRLIKEKTQTVLVPVKSSYLYGAPASGNKVDGRIAAAIDVHPFENLPTFFFGDPDEKIEYRRQKFTQINLDKDGSGILSMSNYWKQNKSPVRLDIHASVYESGGRPVSRKSVVTLMPGDYFYGVEPQFEGRPDANTTVAVKIGCFDARGSHLTDKTFDLSLIRKDRNWYWRYNGSQGWHWEYDETPVVVFSKSVHIADSRTVLVNVPLTWGGYRLEVSDGRTVTGYEFETSWSWWGNTTEDKGQKPDLVSLGFDKTRYLPGETAVLNVNPPEDGLALVTVETSKGVLFSEYKPVTARGSQIEIHTDPSWNRHDTYASVMVIKPGDMKDTPVPSRSFGMIHLPLKREKTKLAVSIDAPQKIEANKNITARIKVDTDGPLPKDTKVVAALVDVGILNITRFKTPDAGAYFFAPRRYNIDLYDNYAWVIDNLGPKSVFQRFGGGFKEALADLARGGDKPKSEVMMVSFFSDPLTPDENGEVTARFDLPNFNGKLRWMVLAFSDERYGQADSDTTVADKIVTQLSMPKFLAKGDRSITALDIRNMSDKPQQLKATMTLDGALDSSRIEKDIMLADKEKTILKFPIEAVSATGQGIIRLSVTNALGDIHINRIWKLGVRSPYPFATRSFSEVIRPQTPWEPAMETKDLLPETIQYQMTLSDKPPLDLGGHFDSLLRYPYGCVEQSISSGYPWVMATTDVAAAMGLDNQIRERFKQEYTEAFRIEQVNNAVDRVLKRHKTNGGFGAWAADSPEHKWLTVYAAEFLNDAKNAGAFVSRTALDKTNKHIAGFLKGIAATPDLHYSDDPSHYEFAYKSYAGFVLAKNGMAALSDLRRLMSVYNGFTKDDGLSWMYLAAAFRITGDEPNAALCFDKAKKEIKRERQGYYGEYGSELRDLAKITELAFLHHFDSENLVFELAGALKQRRWLSTQERNSLFRAALSFHATGRETWSAVIKTEKEDIVIKRDKPFNTIFDHDTYKTVKNIKAGDGRLYADISLVGERREPPQPQSNGLTITRRFYDTKGNPLVLEVMKSGELAVVQLNISASDRTPDGLVVDLLPAGLEIENPNLGLTALDIDSIRIDGKPVRELKNHESILHEEYRDDRYVAAVKVDEYRKLSLFYLVRAVTPGIYKMPPSYVEDMYRPYRFGIGTSRQQIEIVE